MPTHIIPGSDKELASPKPNATDETWPTAPDARAETLSYIPHFARIHKQLKQTSEQIEQSVVSVCGNFYAMAERAKATVERSTAFLESESSAHPAKRTFEELIANCSRTLVKTLESNEEAAAVSEQAIGRVMRMDETSTEILKSLSKLEKIAHENRLLAMNARIEAVHAGEQGAGFGVVAVEVATQSDRSRDVTAEVSGYITSLRTEADTIISDLRKMAQREASRLAQSRSEVNGTLEDLRAAHQEMRHILAGVNEQSALLADDIRSAVRQLQFQDRVSQQIAHVMQDLEALKARIGGAKDGEQAIKFSDFTMREERAIAGLGRPPGPRRAIAGILVTDGAIM